MPTLPSTMTVDALRREAATRARDAADGTSAVAEEYGFDSWAGLEIEVRRRVLLDTRDLAGIQSLLAEHPHLAVAPMRGWCDHGDGTRPLTYIALVRYDTSTGVWRDLAGTGPIATALVEAGAPVDGFPDDPETPLMTAASYGDADVAAALLNAGANPDAVTAGNDGGPALRQAAECGMTAVVEVLLSAGARDLVHAAGAGDITGLLTSDTPERDRVAALRFAAARGRLHVIDQLIGAGTPVDGVDRDGSTALHEAAGAGRATSVEHLLALGADPRRRDTRFDATPLEWAVHQHHDGDTDHDLAGVERLLAPVS